MTEAPIRAAAAAAAAAAAETPGSPTHAAAAATTVASTSAATPVFTLRPTSRFAVPAGPGALQAAEHNAALVKLLERELTLVAGGRSSVNHVLALTEVLRALCRENVWNYVRAYFHVADTGRWEFQALG
ncbi:MAG: hypothetical protein ACK4ZJ_16920, partial [Allorhizobium sp.]